MTESVLNLVVGKLTDLITQEANLLLGVDEQVRLLRHELQWMLMFIQTADTKRRSDPRVKLWVSQLREIAFHAEDVIDEFVVKIDHHQRRQRNSIWLIRYLKMCIHRTYHLSFMHELGSQIQVINTMTEKMSANKSKYCFESIGESSIAISSNNEVRSSQNIRRASYLVQEYDDVDLVNETKEIKGLLMGVGVEQRRVIVSIVGMGGLGKTTLAKKVYNNSDVKRHFDCCAWVSVSQDYRRKEMLQDIINCVITSSSSKDKDKEEEEKDLSTKLREYLQDNMKYLIVLDDVWDIDAWNVLKYAFPDQSNGSRVLITTRSKDIALHVDPLSNTYKLRFLNDKESWELFRKKIFPSGVDAHPEAICPTELEMLGKEMVGRCRGLPLAIVVLGGILSAKDKTSITWSKVNDSLKWHLSNIGGSNSCMAILALSYYDLPDYLKPIFLYIGIFPEDHEISATRLIQYLVAEGFIRRRDKETLEDIAEDYLEVLINKSMIQVTELRADGRAKYCRIHDLLRDLSIREAEDDKFFHHQHENINFSSSIDVRRLIIHDNDLIEEEKFISQNLYVQHLRSLICFSFSFGEQHFRCFINSVKLLKVLELRNARSLVKLPKEIGQLVHLHYLGLSNTHIENLPHSICRLVNLQTLDVRNTFHLRCIPNVFHTLHQLRHLYLNLNKTFCFSMTSSFISNRCFRSKCTLGLDNLTNLQTLVIPVGDWMNTDDGGLGQLRMLRKLVLYGSLVPYKKLISDSIMKLDGLRSLEFWYSEEIPEITSFSSFTYLHKLYLDGRLEKLPELTLFPPNLNKLTLVNSKLTSDPMVILQQLPNLKFLILSHGVFNGKKMICFDRGFLQLQYLKFFGLLNLEEWIVENGALRSLRDLVIHTCDKLKMIPDGLQEVTTLKALTLRFVSIDLKSRVRDGGEDWSKIKHIPSVQIP